MRSTGNRRDHHTTTRTTFLFVYPLVNGGATRVFAYRERSGHYFRRHAAFLFFLYTLPLHIPRLTFK